MVLAQPDMERPTAIRPSRPKNVHRQGGYRRLHHKAQDAPFGVTTPGDLGPRKQPLERVLNSWHTLKTI